MSKRAWMPLYVGDYLGDTGHLSTSQHGAYLLLMMHYWRTGGLPSDDEQLSAITKLPIDIWLKYRKTIQAFFYDGWQHKRIDMELAEMEVKRRKRVMAGQKGGTQASINRRNIENIAFGRALPQQTSSNATALKHHSHSQRKKEREEVSKEGIEVSSSLLASLTKMRTL